MVRFCDVNVGIVVAWCMEAEEVNVLVGER